MVKKVSKKMNNINQHEIASRLIAEIRQDIEDLEELDADFLLDMMGVIGVSFTVSDDASVAFILSAFPPPSED